MLMYILGYIGRYEELSEEQYYIVKKKALPEILLKVVEAKRLIDSERVMTVQEATDAVEISRSSFYKYRDDIFPFYEHTRGKTITFMIQMDDTPGLLSRVLSYVARSQANILTIHQTIPVNRIALLTLSIEILPQTESISVVLETIEGLEGIHYVKTLARE